LATCLPLYTVIYRQQAAGVSPAAKAMSDMAMNNMGVYWAFPVLQATGIAALIWAYLGVCLGLLESGKPVRWLPLTRAQVDRVHRQISLLVLSLILIHAVTTAFDQMGDNAKTAFLPWQEPWSAAVFGYNTGIFAFYLALLVGPSYYLRRRIGPARWRFVHRFALVVYVLSLWHTLLLGADFAYYEWIRPVTWLAQVPLLGLFVRRLLMPRGARHEQASQAVARAIGRYGLAAAGAGAALAVVVVVVTGHAGLPHRV